VEIAFKYFLNAFKVGKYKQMHANKRIWERRKHRRGIVTLSIAEMRTV
jgi:hypothetical protein